MSEPGVSKSVSPSPESLGGSPGTVLRRCREFHGITIEEASDFTKIGVSYLKALEDDQIHKFANQAYLKGFLRIYATYLGLNSDDVARMYDKLFGVKSEKTDTAGTPATLVRPPHRLSLLKKMLFPAVLLAAILITATFFKRPPEPVVRPPQPAATAVTTQQSMAVQMVQSSVRNSSKSLVAPVSKEEKLPADPPEVEKPVTAKSPVEAARGFILKIRVTQNGTLTAAVDGSGPQQYDLTSGDVIEWKAEKNVTLELSNAGGVDVELNGKAYKPLGPLGKPVYVEFDSGGVKQ